MQELAARPASVVAMPAQSAELVRSMSDVVARMHRIKEVQTELMKANVHYGTIPGTNKPTLYQPGADLLNVTFRIAPRVRQLEDLTTPDGDTVRYRVTMEGLHQANGEYLGEGVGECSSDEEKYKWRRVTCKEEFEETPVDRRREKWQRGRNDTAYKVQQVRTNVADVANTVLKIAAKRAKVAMTLNVLAASDVFNQDLEDLTDELREQVVAEQSDDPQRPAPPRPGARSAEKQQQAAGRETPSADPPPPEKAPPAPPPPPEPPREPPREPPAPKGHLVKVHPRPNGAAILELDTGFHCSTRDAALITKAQGLVDLDPRVVVVVKTRPSADPSKYVPILEAIDLTE